MPTKWKGGILFIGSGEVDPVWLLFCGDLTILLLGLAFHCFVIENRKSLCHSLGRPSRSDFVQSGFTVLKNENWYVTTDSDKKILFTGLDDSMLGNVYMPDSTKIYDSNYNILLIHEPDTADSFQEYPYDLVLSGHSHGGQVNIPFIPAINQKAISSTNLAKNYVSGMYELNSKTKIYVNTGIGTTHVSGRLGVVPEISIFHIYL